MELLWVEYPPVAIVVIEWQIESKSDIPANFKHKAHIRVKSPYMIIIEVAIFLTLSLSLSVPSVCSEKKVVNHSYVKVEEQLLP